MVSSHYYNEKIKCALKSDNHITTLVRTEYLAEFMGSNSVDAKHSFFYLLLKLIYKILYNFGTTLEAL